MENITGILLCGGKSLRMGKDKALVNFADKPMALYSLEVLKQYCSHILVSANDDRFDYLGFDVIADEFQSIGPIGGLYSCLKYSHTNYNLVMACDMPFISGSFLKKKILNTNDKDAIIPLIEGQPEPLYALYHIRILQLIEHHIQAKSYSMRKLLQSLNVQYLKVEKEDELEFSNANTPEEFLKFEQIAQNQYR